MFVLLDPGRRPVIGHRGDRAHAPENTIPALRQAVAKGAEALELDLQLSKDGIPVLLHDPTLDRTTDARGAVRDRTVAELQKADAGARCVPVGAKDFPWRGQGVRIPTLEEALEAVPDLPLIIEMKSLEVARPALDVLQRTRNAGRVLIGSFVDAALAPFQEVGIPVSAPSGILSRLYLPALFRRRPSPLPFQAMCLPRSHKSLPLPIRGFAAMMRASGGATHIWTVNDPAVAARLWAAGVNGIISDDPAAILRVRGGGA